MIHNVNEIKVSGDAWLFMAFVAGIFGFGWWPFVVIILAVFLYQIGNKNKNVKKGKRN